MSDDYGYRSTGITRKVLIALNKAPMGCYMIVASLISIALTPLLIRMTDLVLRWLGLL